jgi:hypothetical protein
MSCSAFVCHQSRCGYDAWAFTRYRDTTHIWGICKKPNYGERYHNGEAIATGFVESTVNEVVSKQFCKKQQMQWSKEGAHLLLQTRVRTLNGELGAIFKRWYPDMDIEVDEVPAAA